MKKLKVLFVLALFGGFLMSAGMVHAYTFNNFNGYWMETSNTAHSLSWTFTNAISEFGIVNDSGNTLTLLNSSIFSTTFDIYESGGKWYATKLDANRNPTGVQLLLGMNDGSKEFFKFYFKDGAGNILYVYDVDLKVVNHEYWLYKADTLVVVNDASPVPLPPSALLMGSGLVGLIGFGLRRRRNRVS